LPSSSITLKAHIDDNLNVILLEVLNEEVLVEYSYCVMVPTGVIKGTPEQLSHVTFADAKVSNAKTSSG